MRAVSSTCFCRHGRHGTSRDAKADAWHHGFTGAGGGDPRSVPRRRRYPHHAPAWAGTQLRPCRPPAQDTGHSREHKGTGKSSFIILLEGSSQTMRTLCKRRALPPRVVRAPCSGASGAACRRARRLTGERAGRQRQRLLPRSPLARSA